MFDKRSSILLLSFGIVLTIVYGVNTNKAAPRVAIIGGGIGGSSTAYFLKQLLPDVSIHLFEKTGILGGRLNVTTIFGNGYETGGSIIHPRNKYAVDLSKTFGLESRSDTGEALSIIKNDEYVFNTSKWTIITIVKTLARYGLNFNHLEAIITKFIDLFSRIYDFQQQGRTFKNTEEMLEAMDPQLLNLTTVSFKSFLHSEKLSKNFIEELVQAITFVNYGQDLSIPAFVGSVSAAGAGSALWSISKGNKQLPEALASSSEAKVNLNTAVTEIILLPEGGYKLISDNGVNLGEFDNVVIAIPLDAKNHLKFTNFKVPPYEYPPTKKYHRTVATIVAGWTHEKYRYRTDIISCVPNWYNSISLIHPTILLVAEKYPVYKIFSGKPLTEQQLDSIFQERHHVEVHDWLAYPEYNKLGIPKMKGFILAPKLYYLNSIEWVASAMEMSLISAKNIALMIAQDQNNI